MNSEQIESLLKPFAGYLGVFAVNFFPDIENVDEFCVFNSKCWPCTTEIGHWLVAYRSNEGLEFFDSYGLRPEYYGLGASHLYDIFYSTQQIQSIYTAVCGQYCVLFCTHRANGGSFENFIDKFHISDHERNDILVRKSVDI